MVWSRPDNDPTATPRLKRVVRTIVTHPVALLHITYESAAGTIETLSGTGEHPFFVVDKNAFVAAKDLSLGDEFRLLDGSSAWVTAISRETAPADAPFTTYNFTVENDHTYHVGQTGVWVHNTGSEICQQLGKKLQNHLKQFPNLPDKEVREYLERELHDQLGDIADSEMAKHIDDVLKASGKSISRPSKLKFTHKLNPSTVTDIDSLKKEIQNHINALNEILKREGMKGLKRRLSQWEEFGDQIEAAGRKHTKSLGPAGPKGSRKVWPHYPDMATGGRPKSAVGLPADARLNSIIGGQADRLRQDILDLPDDITELDFDLDIR